MLKTLNISHNTSTFFVSSMKNRLLSLKSVLKEAITPFRMHPHTGRTVVAETVAVVVTTGRPIVGRRAVSCNDRTHIDVVRQFVYEIGRQAVPDVVFGGAKVYVSELVVRVRRSDNR